MRPQISLITILLATLMFPAGAHAFTLGAADGSTQAAPFAQLLGARTYRLVMDSTQPLESYAPRVEAFRALGMRPQIVVDGIGTPTRGRTGKNWQTINYAIRAFRRWPDAYSVSVINEPDLAGLGACQYAATFRRAYRMLKAVGVPRVLFGEFSPKDRNPVAWTNAIAGCPGAPVVADGWAWHCYDMLDYYGIQRSGAIRRMLAGLRHRLRTPRGNALAMYCTEYGVLTRGEAAMSEEAAARRWAHAIAYVRKYRVEQIVAWQILPVHGGNWDTSTVRSDGSRREAFAAIASAR